MDGRRKIFAILLALVAILWLPGCGSESSDDHNEHAMYQRELTPRETDIAFASAMIPHHASAIQMARLARQQAEHRDIKELAASIIASQEDEIGQLEAAYERITGQKSQSRAHAQGGMSHDMMGMSADEMGMDMDPAELDGAEPFDKAFIEMMVPHHEGAVKMAQVQLDSGSDEELKALSLQIIEAQDREIAEMNQWLQEWYGS